MKRTLGLVLLGCLAVVWGLWSNAARVGGAEKKKGTQVEIDGLTSVTPAEWKEQELSEMARRFRLKQFHLPRVDGDKEDAELVISAIFGKGSGGLKANLERWKGMVIPPKGKKIDEVSKVEKIKAGDVPVTWFEVYGTYKGLPFEKIKPKPHYRMVKIYFDSKNGPYYLTLVGPDKTVEKHKKAFRDWIKGFK